MIFPYGISMEYLWFSQSVRRRVPDVGRKHSVLPTCIMMYIEKKQTNGAKGCASQLVSRFIVICVVHIAHTSRTVVGHMFIPRYDSWSCNPKQWHSLTVSSRVDQTDVHHTCLKSWWSCLCMASWPPCFT